MLHDAPAVLPGMPLGDLPLEPGTQVLVIRAQVGPLTALHHAPDGPPTGTVLIVPGFTGSKEDHRLLLPELAREFNEVHRFKSPEEQEQVTNGWGHEWTPVEPPRENPEHCRAVISCHGSGPASQSTVILQGNCGYEQAGSVAVAGIERILAGDVSAAGFVSPAAAFGARYLLAALERDGLLKVIVRN